MLERHDQALNPPWHRWWMGFIALNAAGVAWFGIVRPRRLDESFTWANLPPLHARFVGALYLWGAIMLIWSFVAARRSAWWPVTVAAAIFTSMMGVLTALNTNAFEWSLTPVKVWVFAYIIFPVTTIALSLAYRRGAADGGPSPRHSVAMVRGLQVLAVVFGIVGLALLFFREQMVDVWPWPVSNGVAQFYSGPFLAIAWCAWAYSRRPVADGHGFVLATAVLGLAVILVSVKHRELFDAGDLASWIWFAAFSVITIGFGGVAVRSIVTGSSASRVPAAA